MEKKRSKKVDHICVTKTIVIVIDVLHEVKIHQIVQHPILDLDVQNMHNYKSKSQHYLQLTNCCCDFFVHDKINF